MKFPPKTGGRGFADLGYESPIGTKICDMDRLEIVAPGSNGEAVFSVFLQKMAFGLKKE